MTKNLQHVSAVGIQFSAALSALGQNAAELQHALTNPENTLSQRGDLIAGRSVWVGASDQTLVQTVPESLNGADSRNLRFALTALAQIETEIHAYTAQFAKQRLAVIIGTSTSGIADNEPVLKVAVSTVSTAVCTAPKARNGQFSGSLTTVFGLGRASLYHFYRLLLGS